MAGEFEGGFCGGNCLNSLRNFFSSSPYSSQINDLRWPLNHDLIIDMKTARSTGDGSAGPASDGGGSCIVLQAQQPTVNGNMSIPLTLQMMGISLSSSTTNQDLHHDNGSAGLNSSTTCEGLSTSLPLNSSSYSYNLSLLETLFVSNSQEMDSVEKKVSNEPAIETPSPLPTLKVPMKKIGDRITALQQMVAPFGKTDTASVLLETIGYIKFLQCQVGALSTPYYRSSPLQCQQAADRIQDEERLIQDLKSRGLCLVPISIASVSVAETAMDLWFSK